MSEKQTINKIKVVRNGDRKPEHPLYMAFTNQIGAAVAIARQIKAEQRDFSVPAFVEHFLDEFGRKAA